MDWDRRREITYKLLSKHTQHRKKYFTLMLSWVVRNKETETPFSPSYPFFPQTQLHYIIPNSSTSPFPKQHGRNGGCSQSTTLSQQLLPQTFPLLQCAYSVWAAVPDTKACSSVGSPQLQCPGNIHQLLPPVWDPSWVAVWISVLM